MLRLVWIVLALAVSAFFGAQWFFNNAQALRWFAETALGGQAYSPGPSVTVAVSGAVTTAFFSAFVLIFGCLLAVDFAKFQGLAAGLGRLRQLRRNGGQIDQPSFLRVFRDDDQLSTLAADFCDTLHEEPFNGAVRLRLTVPPSRFFGSGLLVDRALYLSVFRYLPVFLVGSGAVALVLALLEAMVTAGPAAAAGEPLAWLTPGLQSGLFAFALAGSAGIAAGLLTRLGTEVRYQQTDSFHRALESLFHGLPEADYLRALTSTTSADSADLLDTVHKGSENLLKELNDIGRRIENALDANAVTVGRTLSDAVAEALAKPMAKITDLARRQSKDQTEQVVALLKGVLASFEIELEKRFGSQLKEVNVLLQSTAAMAAGMETSLSETAGAITVQSERQIESMAAEFRQGLENRAEQEAESRAGIVAELGAVSRALGEDVRGHSEQFGKLLNSVLDRIEYLTESAVAATAADLTKTAESLNGLREVVESLVLSVAPALNQVVDTQQRLVGALDDEQAAGRVIARSATDMNAAAKASRETVERFIVLAERMTETRHAATAGRQPPPAAAQAPQGPPDETLSRAIRQLRETTEDGIKKLPRL